LEALEAVVASTDRLQRLAIVIRKSSVQSRNLKAATFVAKDEEGNDFGDFAIFMVKHRYKAASEALCEQLGASISLRRKRFLYRQKHQKKLAHKRQNRVPETQPTPLVDRRIGSVLQQELSQSSNVLAPPRASQPKTLQHTAPSETNPSILDSKVFRKTPLDYKTSPSIISTGSSIQDSALEYPQTPAFRQGQRECVCPYCCELLPTAKLRDKRWWRSVDSIPTFCYLS
jgi:hypothetical protein